MLECECPIPNPRGATPNKPNDDERCVKCGLWINPEWTSNDGTMGEFYDRLEEALFPLGVLNAPTPSKELAEFREFRTQCEVRELAGRKRFGHKMLARDNPREASEEAADFSNYLLFDLLQKRRAGERDEWAIALSGAARVFEAWKFALAQRDHRHRGMAD